VYIGNLFIDELFQIQWTTQQNVQPVYGYDSRYADAYVDGRSLIQGQLAINYSAVPNYLYNVLKEYSRLLPTAVDAKISYQDSADSKELVALTSASKSGGLTPNVQTAVDNKIGTLLASPAALKAAKAALAGNTKQDDYVNPCYFPTIFDMKIEIGTDANMTYRMLENVRLSSDEMVVAQDGQSLAISYSFIARRAR